MGPYTNTPIGGYTSGGGSLNLSMTSPSSNRIFDPGYIYSQKQYNPYSTSPKYSSQRMFGSDSIRGDHADMFPGQNPYAMKNTIWGDIGDYIKDPKRDWGAMGDYDFTQPKPVSGPNLGSPRSSGGGRVSYRPTRMHKLRSLLGVDDLAERRAQAMQQWATLIRRNPYAPLV